MELQFYGANSLSLAYKGTRIIIDDNLADLGAKSVTKPGDVALFTGPHEPSATARLSFDSPGDYEVADISVIGIAARSHLEASGLGATMFKLTAGDLSVLVTGHIYPELSDIQLETINQVDVLVVPVGGNGYTIDPAGALKLIRATEPKLVVPTHYADKALKYEVPQQELAVALKELAMEPKETVAKLRLKPTDLSDLTQLIVIEKS
jgi:L-ascorbate metabolism protein UlaG (beta-lactamase superfamily)